MGSIRIDYYLTEDGDAQFTYETEGDLAVITQVGLLEMAKDGVLHPPEDDE